MNAQCLIDNDYANPFLPIYSGPDGKYSRNDFHPSRLRKLTNMWQEVMPKINGWNSIYLDNHDSGRSLSRYGSDRPEHRAAAAKLFAIYLTTLCGTPYLLAGQEIGMANLGQDYGVEAYIDVEAKNAYNEILQRRGGDASSMEDVLAEMRLKARDHGRLPMQFTASTNAGFTTPEAKPWMTVNKDHREWNVESQLDDSESVLAFYRKMIALRKQHKDLLIYGSFSAMSENVTGEMALGWERQDDRGTRAVTLLNFSDREQTVSVSYYDGFSVLISNGEATLYDRKVELGPYGALVLKK